MKLQKKSYHLCFLLSVFLLTVFAAMPVKAANPSLNFKERSISAGRSFTLKVKGGSDFRFSSSNKKVATVHKTTGRVKAVSKGKATIYAKKGSFTLKCKLTVVQPIDVMIFAGQSNMMGAGDTNLIPNLTKGAGYAYYPVTNKNSILTIHENKGQPFGFGQQDAYINHNVSGMDVGIRERGSLVTAFMNAYYQKTKVPILAVPATSAGSGSVSWVETKYKGVIKRTNSAVKVAKKKGLTVRHVYMVWLQGENDAFSFMTAAAHSSNMKKLYKKISKEAPIEKVLVINIPPYYGEAAGEPDSELSEEELAEQTAQQELTAARQAAYAVIQNSYRSLCKSNKNFVMISDLAPTFPAEWMYADGLHLTQHALNTLGTDAGARAGSYVKSQK